MNNPKNTSESIRQRIRAKKINEASLPSVVSDWLKDAGTSEQTSMAKKVANWAEKAGTRISGGTSVGRAPQSLVLDVRYQAGEIRVNDEGVATFLGKPLNSAKDFSTIFDEYKRSSDDLKKYFKVTEPAVNESEDDEYPAIFKMQTSGGKYGLEVYQSEIDKKDDKYSYREFTSGRSSGGGGGMTKDSLTKWLNDMIKDSGEVDGIRYKVTDNKLGIELNENATGTATGTVDKVLAFLKGEGGDKIDGVLVDSSTANLISDIYSKLTDSDLKLKCQNMTYPKLANVCWKLASKNGVSWKSEGIAEGKGLVPGQLYVCESALGKSLGKYLNPKPTILGTYHMFESLNSSLPLVFMESELPAQVKTLVVESTNFDEMAKVFEETGAFKYTFSVSQKDWDAWKEKQKDNYTFSKSDGVDAAYNDGEHIMSFNPDKKEVYADIPKFLDKEGITKSVNDVNEDKYDDITDQLVEGTKFEDVEGATYTVISRSGDNITFRSDKDDDHNIWNGEKTTSINGPNSVSLFCKILSSPSNEGMVTVDDKGTKGFEDQSELEAYLDKKYGSDGCARTPEGKDTIYARTSDWKEVARWKGDDDYGTLSESMAEGAEEPDDVEALQKELDDLMMSTAGKSNESEEDDEDELNQDPMSVDQYLKFVKKKTGKELSRSTLPSGKAMAKFIYDNFREIMHRTDYDDETASNRIADILSYFHMDEEEFNKAWSKLTQ